MESSCLRTGCRRSAIMRSKDTAIFTSDEPLPGCQRRDSGGELLLCRRVYVVRSALRLLLVPFSHARDPVRLLAQLASSLGLSLTTAGGERARRGIGSVSESLGIVLMNANTARAVNPVFTVTPSSKIQRKKRDQVENCILNVRFWLFRSLEPLAFPSRPASAGRSALVGARRLRLVCALCSLAPPIISRQQENGYSRSAFAARM